MIDLKIISSKIVEFDGDRFYCMDNLNINLPWVIPYYQTRSNNGEVCLMMVFGSGNESLIKFVVNFDNTKIKYTQESWGWWTFFKHTNTIKALVAGEAILGSGMYYPESMYKRYLKYIEIDDDSKYYYHRFNVPITLNDLPSWIKCVTSENMYEDVGPLPTAFSYVNSIGNLTNIRFFKKSSYYRFKREMGIK